METNPPKRCPFCHLLQPILKENDLAYVLLSNPRKTKGHTLVIPKRHVENPGELSNEETVAIFELIRYVQTKLLTAVSLGCDVRQHFRPFLSESQTKVNHVHYHVLPRNPEDALFKQRDLHEKTLFADLTPEEFESMRKVLM